MSIPPSIILIRPQLSENIGTTARAMMNCALTDLRLVGPREDWLSDRAIAAASGAESILQAGCDAEAGGLGDSHPSHDRHQSRGDVRPRAHRSGK
jgi:tRNA/rRNA methyltransferase